MASRKDYLEFILDKLNILDNITYKPMMGEYLLYYDGKLFGGLYDDRLLIKKVNSNEKYNLEEDIPYDGAKAMYLVDDVDNSEQLKEIIIETCKDLPSKK